MLFLRDAGRGKEVTSYLDRNSDKDTIKVSTNFVTPISYVSLSSFGLSPV